MKFDGFLKQLLNTYEDEKGINNIDGLDLPDVNEVCEVLHNLFRIIFPGFYDHSVKKEELADQLNVVLYTTWPKLTKIVRQGLGFKYRNSDMSWEDLRSASETTSMAMLNKLPEIRQQLKRDIQAAIDWDPAAQSFEEIILSYPCIHAITTYRIAHVLYGLDVPLIPRMMSESSHSKTGIDINPGAEIGHSFFIDHGTGVVIGETSIIGNNVTLYQGVTIGALKPKKSENEDKAKRHPTLEDNVTVYAGATILGGETTIGTNSIIGGNVWLTHSVSSNSRVLAAIPENQIKELH